MRTIAIVLAGLAVACGGGGGSGSGSGGSDETAGTGGTGDTAGDDGVPADCADVLPARRLRRLTHVEYDRTIRDLVGLDLSLATKRLASHIYLLGASAVLFWWGFTYFLKYKQRDY